MENQTEKPKVEDELQSPVLRVVLDVYIPYRDGSGKGNVLPPIEAFIDLKKGVSVNNVMKKIREGVISAIVTARDPSKSLPPQRTVVPGMKQLAEDAVRQLKLDENPEAA